MTGLVPATYVDAQRARSSRISLISIMGARRKPTHDADVREHLTARPLDMSKHNADLQFHI
jgi:hypothetical protein